MRKPLLNGLIVGLFALVVLAVIGAIAYFQKEPTSELFQNESALAPRLVSDFVPPSGRAVGPSGDPQDLGPWTGRLMFATSLDGKTFSRTGTVFVDQGAVPDLAIAPDGKLYLYYTGWTVGERQNETVVGISEDEGITWTYHYLVFEGFEEMPSPVDPDVIIRDDGTFLLYLTSQARGDAEAHTFVATGTDGVNFTNQGAAVAVSDEPILDPDAFYLDGTWHLFAGGIYARNWHATSDDGFQYSIKSLEDFLAPSDYQSVVRSGEIVKNDQGEYREAYMVANAVGTDDGIRLFGFATDGSAIRSWDSADGFSWSLNEEVALSADTAISALETGVTSDPSVVQFSNGRYFMVYSTMIPE